MSARGARDLAASVRDRLWTLARERGEDVQVTLIRFAVERLLYRLSRSEYREAFLLEGAMLFSVWELLPHRSTRDLDLLGRGSDNPNVVRRTIAEILATPVEPDGLDFGAGPIEIEPLHEGQDYQGVQVSLVVRLGMAKIPLQIDIAFGQSVRPEAVTETFPSLLGLPPPTLLAYPREVVVAEKFQTITALGITNSRMKDFFDLAYIAAQFEFDARRLAQAVEATFQRRRTEIPATPPLALTRAFFESKDRKRDWSAFRRRAGLDSEAEALESACGRIERLLAPICDWIRRGEVPPVRWNPETGWPGE